jgi:tetratricopeptide (TPR) repeat protein
MTDINDVVGDSDQAKGEGAGDDADLPELELVETLDSAPSDAVRAILDEVLPMVEVEGWEGAVEVLREALERFPEDPYVLSWLGMAERELGMESMALERFRQALAAEPRDPVLLATVGNALASWDDPEAEGALRTAALLAPGLAQARWMYGAWLAREGLFEEGIAELEAALVIEPEDPLIQTEHGVALALSGQIQTALGAFSRAAELDPEDGWALSLLGLAYLELEDLDESARALIAAAYLRPDDLDLQLLTALALGAIEEDTRALEMLERARLHGEEGLDRVLILEVEEALEDGATASRRLLERNLGPSSFRERMMQRP